MIFFWGGGWGVGVEGVEGVGQYSDSISESTQVGFFGPLNFFNVSLN